MQNFFFHFAFRILHFAFDNYFRRTAAAVRRENN